ncbi:MAG: septum formation initiator family protein [Anaerolineae bacterium]|nr:MAG: septum formation initiator family protein [Anaerolineae bacterium]
MGRDLEYRAAMTELQQWNDRLATEQKRGEHLQQELEWVQSDAYLEEAARRELGLVRRGDTLVVPVSAASTPAVTPTPAARGRSRPATLAILARSLSARRYDPLSQQFQIRLDTRSRGFRRGAAPVSHWPNPAEAPTSRQIWNYCR